MISVCESLREDFDHPRLIRLKLSAQKPEEKVVMSNNLAENNLDFVLLRRLRGYLVEAGGGGVGRSRKEEV